MVQEMLSGNSQGGNGPMRETQVEEEKNGIQTGVSRFPAIMITRRNISIFCGSDLCAATRVLVWDFCQCTDQ